MEKNCDWEPDSEDSWSTACRKIFTFSDGGIAENGFEFCPFCGGRINVLNEAES